MDYEKTEDGQIQAAFARRVGKVLLQYEAATQAFAPADKHEATLCICLLQAVLTQCAKAMQRKGGPLRQELDAVLNVQLKDHPPRFGFDEGCISMWGQTNSFPKYRDIIQVIRNALSHPTVQSGEGHPTTGYITVLEGTGFVQEFRFVASPWVNDAGRPKGYAAGERESKMRQAREIVAADQKTKLEWVERCGNYFLSLEGQPFVRHTIVTLSVLQLRTLTLELSDLLAGDSGPGLSGQKASEVEGQSALATPSIGRGAPDGGG